MGAPAILALVEAALPTAIKLVAQLIAMLKGLGGNTTALEANVTEMEGRIPSLIIEVRAYVAKRHPDDTGE